jgi:hypothetical protein
MRTQKSLRKDDHYCKLTQSQRRFFHSWKRAHDRQLQAAAVNKVIPITAAPTKTMVRSAA